MSDTQHARFSPSGSKRWFACPGSLVLEASIPNKSNEYSDDGTAKHEIARRCRVEKLPADGWAGALVPVHAPHEEPRYVKFSDEMAEKVQPMVDVVDKLAEGARVDLIEHRVDFSDVVQVPNQFGTLDIGILRPDGELVVADYKFGHTPVEVRENTQLLIYALALYNELSLAHDITGIRLVILQPEAAGVTEWTCSVDYLFDFAQTLRSKACSVLNAERDYGKVDQEVWERTYLNQNPNDQECAFCRAMATCPSAQRKVQETVGASFSVIVEGDAEGCRPADLILDHCDRSEEAEGSPAFLGVLMAATPFIEDWIKAVRAEVERRLLAGQPVEGFGLELGRKGARKWTDEALVEKTVRDKWRLKLEDAYDFSLKSPTSFEKLAKPMKVTDPVSGLKVEVKPLIGPRRWADMQEWIRQSDPKPSVKPIAQIKNPYTPPQPDASAFQATTEVDDLAS